MNTLKPHIPGFVDADTPPDIQFESSDELIEHEKVKWWRSVDGFFRFSVSSKEPTSILLMAERFCGRQWHVVGYLATLEGVTLPEWTPVEEPVAG